MSNTRKVILNKCYGGFDVSIKATLLYAYKKHMRVYLYELYERAYRVNKYRKVNKSIKELLEEATDFSNDSFFTRKYLLLTKDFGDYLDESFLLTWNSWETQEEKDEYMFWYKEVEPSVLNLDSSYRTDKTLIKVVEELGKEASTSLSDLRIVEIPYKLDYVIDNYDGIELLHKKVQVW